MACSNPVLDRASLQFFLFLQTSHLAQFLRLPNPVHNLFENRRNQNISSKSPPCGSFGKVESYFEKSVVMDDASFPP